MGGGGFRCAIWSRGSCAFFWFKVCGVILSLIAECVFSFKKKVIFLQNIGFAPIKMLKNIYLVDFVIYLLLCIVIVVYI